MEYVKNLLNVLWQALSSDKAKRAYLRIFRGAVSLAISEIAAVLVGVPALVWLAPLVMGLDKFVRDK